MIRTWQCWGFTQLESVLCYKPGTGSSTCCCRYWKGSCLIWSRFEKFPSSICRECPAVGVNPPVTLAFLHKNSTDRRINGRMALQELAIGVTFMHHKSNSHLQFVQEQRCPVHQHLLSCQPLFKLCNKLLPFKLRHKAIESWTISLSVSI